MAMDTNQSRHWGWDIPVLFDNQETFSFKTPILTPSRKHTVLFRCPLSYNKTVPNPMRGDILWDSDHVKLPHSIQSSYILETTSSQRQVRKLRWELIEQKLLQPIKTIHDLEDAIKAYNSSYKNEWNFQGLRKLVNDVFSESERISFFDELLPFIINTALRIPTLIQCSIPLLKQGAARSISMTQEQACSLLACAFLCMFPRRNTEKRDSEYGNYPTINFNRLFGCIEPSALEKLKCILHYFSRISNEMPRGVITFERKVISTAYEWEKSYEVFSAVKFHVSAEGKIESAEGMSQVDFANMKIGGGVLGRGCVQEEIRFVINPEMIVARLFTEELADNEALVMIGQEQFSCYDGYSDTFKFGGNFDDKTPLDAYRRKHTRVIAIDALKYESTLDQFLKKNITRDLNKAFAGFICETNGERSPVASGLWGCGAFKGVGIRSAIIQYMVAVATQRHLVFFSNGNETVRDDVGEIFKTLSDKFVTIRHMFRLLHQYLKEENAADPQNLVPFLKRELDKYKPDPSTLNKKPSKLMGSEPQVSKWREFNELFKDDQEPKES